MIYDYNVRSFVFLKVAFKMFKLENGEFIEYPLGFKSSTCDIWNGLYNVKDMANYGNITACDVEKVFIPD